MKFDMSIYLRTMKFDVSIYFLFFYKEFTCQPVWQNKYIMWHLSFIKNLIWFTFVNFVKNYYLKSIIYKTMNS